MVNGIRRVVIWAHSECRSNAALYAAVRKRAAEQGIAVKIYLWNQKLQPESRKIEIEDAVVVGEDYAKGLTVLREFGGPGSVQAFCVYQNSSVWRRLIAKAKRGGAYSHGYTNCRSASRNGDGPATQYYNFGCRVICPVR